MDERILQVARKYNRRHVHLFKQNGAAQKLLHPVGLFLGRLPDINYDNIPLALTVQDEKQCFIALHFLKFKLHRLIKQSRFTGSRTKIVLANFIALRNRIINANLGLVYYIAGIRGKHLDHHNKVSDGQLVLISATEYFDPWHSVRFSTYATTSIIRKYFKKRISTFPLFKEQGIEGINYSCELLRRDRLSRLITKIGDDPDRCGLTFLEWAALQARFGLNGYESGLTLIKIGKLMQPKRCAETTRDLINNALTKVRIALAEDPILSDDSELQHLKNAS